jgi:peptidoglycan/xylan/chitin deacetylase (PgdA/CDA1 family)
MQSLESSGRPADPGINPHKRRLAAALDRVGLLDALLSTRARRGPYIRCVNYHEVPPARAESLDRQIRWFAEHFEFVGPKELTVLLEGQWPYRRPGILLTFDDGCRTHAEVVAPLLEKHGAVGWFSVPSAFCDVPEAGQREWARLHAVSAWAADGDPRLALTWDQVRALDLRHVVVSHTRDHVRLADSLGQEAIREQVFEGKRRLEEQLGHAVQAFAWVGGEEFAYSAAGARAIAEAGFRFAFGTNNLPVRPGDDPLRIERTNLEAGYPLDLLRFQISGALDWLYAPKRRRLARRLAAA